MVKFEKFQKTKKDVFLFILLGIITVIAVLAALNPEFGQIFTIQYFFKTADLESVPILLAFGFTMLVCFLGALVPFPIPYALPITLFTAVWLKQYPPLVAWGYIILLVLLATVANMVGDLVDYWIGQGTQYVMSHDDPEAQNRWAQIILSRPKAIPYVILLFGLTPLPDSLLMVPLGMVKYNLKKTMVWMFIGRFFMMLIFALAGVFAFDLAFGEGSGDNGTGWILGVVLLYVLWVLIVAMVKISPENNSTNGNDQNADSNP